MSEFKDILSFNRDLDVSVDGLYQSYKLMLRKGMIKEAESIDRAQMLAACANINASCHTLLDKIHQIRLYRTLNEQVVDDDDENNEED